MSRAVVLSAVRTPVGRYGGALAGERPDDLAALVIKAAVERAGVAADEIEDVYFGAANQAGEDNRNVARMAALLAGLPESVAGVTVNRLCASGLSAVVSACHAVAAGDGDLFVAGGVESMSRAPLVMAKPDAAWPRGNQTAWDTTLGWRFPNPKMEAMFPLESMGETGENVAERYEVSRKEQDAFALQSQQRWLEAADEGRFDDELVPVGDVARDEHPRPDTARQARQPEARVPRRAAPSRPGNSSGINDGAAALVIASEERAQELGRRAARRVRRQRRRRRRPARDGHRPGARGAQAARAGRRRRRRHRPRRAERGVRLPEPRRHPRARARPGARERQRRRDRDRPPARHERRAARHRRSCTSCGDAAAATGWRRSASASARDRRPSSSAMSDVQPRKYLELGLRLGKHLDELVDSYYGPPEIAEQVEAEEPRDPAALAEDAARIREGADNPWIAAQLTALETAARKLAGEEISYQDEIERYYGIPAERVPRGAVRGSAQASSTRLFPETARSPSATRPGGGRHPVRRAARPRRGEPRRGGPPPDGRALRATARRVGRLGVRDRRAVGRLQPLPRRPAEQDRGQHRRSVQPDLPRARRRARDVSGPPHRARVEGAAPRPRAGPHRGDARPERLAAVTGRGGNRRALRRDGARRRGVRR